MNDELRSLLLEGASYFGVKLTENDIKTFYSYMEILKDWNSRMNLTAIEEDSDIIVKHFIDSLSIVPYIKGSNIQIADIGSGAGFPGLPVKIAIPDASITLVDSLEKRVKFLEAVVSKLDMKNVKCIHSRAEDIGANPTHRGKYECVTARAVASMSVLLEYCLPLLKKDGIFIAMKGGNPEELGEFSKALKILGGELHDVQNFVLPTTNMRRTVIIVKKIRQTPTEYPRKSGTPAKSPIN